MVDDCGCIALIYLSLQFAVADVLQCWAVLPLTVFSLCRLHSLAQHQGLQIIKRKRETGGGDQ